MIIVEHPLNANALVLLIILQIIVVLMIVPVQLAKMVDQSTEAFKDNVVAHVQLDSQVLNAKFQQVHQLEQAAGNVML